MKQAAINPARFSPKSALPAAGVAAAVETLEAAVVDDSVAFDAVWLVEAVVAEDGGSVGSVGVVETDGPVVVETGPPGLTERVDTGIVEEVDG